LDTRARLHGAAVELKHALSSQESAEVRLPFLHGAESFQETVTRSEFEAIAAPIIERTRAHCLRTLSDAGLKPADLNAVVLVGGSTRIPLVRQLAEEIFGRLPDTSQHPDETVALGAVIQAGILSGALQKMVLLDVTPLSLGIETFGGLMNVILPRNTTIPAKAGELFTNAVANQQSMLIRVLQGEREMARDNWELGQFQIDFEPGPKGHARVGVQFEIDADGILHILARDTKTNTDKLLEIRHSAVDVDDVRVEEMISASVEHAFDDMHERQWTAAKLKAEELLEAVASALPAAGDAIDSDTRAVIHYADGEVRAALVAEDLTRLKSANNQLDTATEVLAAIIVERAMEQALQRRGLV
jgi:molecular chaperone DnaK